MDFLNPNIQEYCNQHTTEESQLLQKINRDTYAKVLMPRMLSGNFQGQLLKIISQMCKPSRILEIGTYTGYSALCLAEGLQQDGILYTIDINEELETTVRQYFKESKWNQQIKYLLGNAHTIIPELNEKWDLVFIDADKVSYSNYYDLTIDAVHSGGIIIADNVLWSGKVLENNQDSDTKAIAAFNEKIKNDPRVSQVMLPVRDGIYLIRKN